MADERMQTRRKLRETAVDQSRMPPPTQEGNQDRGAGESSGTAGSGESSNATAAGTSNSQTTGSTAGVSTDVLVGQLQERVFGVGAPPMRSEASLLSSQSLQTVRSRRQGSVASTSSKQRRITEAKLALERCASERAKAKMQLAEAEMRVAQATLEAANEASDSSDSEEEVVRPQPPHVEEWVNRTSSQTIGADRREGLRSNPAEPATDRTAMDLVGALASALNGLTARQDRPGEWNDTQKPPRYLSELQAFDGNPSEWMAFSATYEDSRRYFSQIQNIARLRKALLGRAREAVKSMLYTNADPDEIMRSLESRFGRPVNIIKAEINALDKLPHMSEDARDLPTVASAVANCVCAIRQLHQESYLHSHEIAERVIGKMCLHIKFKWYDYRRMSDGQPILYALSQFLTQTAETIQANDTAIKFERPRERERDKDNRQGWMRKTKRPTFHAAIEEYTDSDSDGGNESDDYEYAEMVANAVHKNVKCPCCSKSDHILYKCKDYLQLSVQDRWALIKKTKICFRCLMGNHRSYNCKAKPCGVRGCEAGHHRTLHPLPRVQAEPKKQEAITQPTSQPLTTAIHTIEQALSSVNAIRGAKSYLKIIPVHLQGPKATVQAYALLDDGSTITLIDQTVSDEIGAAGPIDVLRLEGIGGLQEQNSASIDVDIKGVYQTEYTRISARTLQDLKICSQSIAEEDIQGCDHLTEISSQLLYERKRPLVLIGQDNWQLLVAREIKEGLPHQPAATRTQLGWVLHGQRKDARRSSIVNHVCRSEDNELHKIIKEHFQIESLGIEPRTPRNDPEVKAIKMLDEISYRNSDGRFETGLLWKNKDLPMPESRTHALKRLSGIEKKMARSDEFAKEYSKQVNNLIESGYAERATATPTSPRTWYLPHFAVVHPQKQKMRLVFDAAARTNGKCLNDALMTGPDLLQSLFGVLVRFRERKIAVSADIKEMFLRVGMTPEDRDSLRFLWRDKQGHIAEYRMCSLIFGAASSPCTAIYIKNRNALEKGQNYPDAVNAIVKNHYMDDYLASYSDNATAIAVSSQVDQIHKMGSFELRGWASNSTEVRKHYNASQQTSVEIGAPTDYEKTLGLRWSTTKDSLSFTLSLRTSPPDILNGSRHPTKREATSAVMSVFDPLGIASPVLIQGKVMLQNIWRIGTGWDEQVSAEANQQWKDWLKELRQLDQLYVPRCLASLSDEGELHIFVDASEKAYAACAYWRQDRDGKTTVTLIAGKSRVAPLKPTSMPRLELQAALMGARLANSIANETTLKIVDKTFWSDSRTVLAWIKSDPRTFKPFVAHRLAELEDLTTPKEWRWIPTAMNVADDATREAPQSFTMSHRWFNGPEFLPKERGEWPPDKSEKPPLTGEEKTEQVNATRQHGREIPMPDYKRFSSWKRLLHATARFLQCVDKLKRLPTRPPAPTTTAALAAKHRRRNITNTPRTTPPARPTPLLVPLSREHLEKAEKMLVQKVQSDSFKEEIDCLIAKRPLYRQSRLAKIVVEWHDRIITLSSRALAARFQPRVVEHKAILDGKHPITRLLLYHLHVQFGHGNHQTVINEARQRYWIISLRANAKQVTRECLWCKIRRSQPPQTPEGNLPEERLDYKAPPFTNTGVDGFGPMYITIGRRNEKRWGILFTCLTTRAVHIELVASLSTNSMIMALRRMSARRGTPRTMFSDNGTNFQGTQRELAELSSAAASRGIVWKFIPPGAPSMGGCWERLVRSIKTALAATLNERKPSEETLHTLLLEAEHIVNSRPLIEIDLDPNGQEALTPNHFLIGRSCGLEPLGDHVSTDRPDWKAVQYMADQFWKRWLKEYVPTLTSRRNTNPEYIDPQKGDVVIITDSSLPRNTWPRGEIMETYPGPDGRTRIVDVRTAAGTMKRPASRVICIIPAQRYVAAEIGADARGGECCEIST